MESKDFLNFLFRTFVKVDVFLIGLLKENSKIERRKFDEFLSFLKRIGCA